MRGYLARWFIAGLVLAVFTLVLMPKAEATIYYFDYSNEFGAWGGSIPPGYGSVEITKESDGIYFEVNANTNYFTPAETLTWDKFYFNFNPEKTLNTNLIVIDEVGTWSTVEDKNVSMFGIFDYGEEGTALGNNAINPLNFHIADTTLEIEDFVFPSSKDYLFAAHLRRFDEIDGQDSTFLAVSGAELPIPEPSTLLLLGAGLIGLAVARKKVH